MNVVTKASTWLPFLSWARSIERDTLRADLIAGLTGAVLVLPQGVAYALIAGLPPEFGLYTAIVTAIVAALFGSSLHMISGPAAAMSIVVMSVAGAHANGLGPEYYIATVLLVTLLAGMIQLGLGLARLGRLVNFISHTVVIGFTAGAAILIAASQLKHLTGIPVDGGRSFFDGLSSLLRQWDELNLYSVAIGATALFASVLTRRVHRGAPHLMIGMLAASLLCYWIDGAHKGVVLVGALPGTLPQLSLPEFSLEQIHGLASGAFAVAMLGLIEAVSIARAIALRSNQRIDGNQEFIGQGLSNIVGSFFSCYAGSGSFTRSGANYDAGARTPLAAVFAALLLALIVVWLPTLTAYLPLPAMAGGILLIAWNLIDCKQIREVMRASREEALILWVTLAATLLLELEFAIYIGILISLVSYLLRTSRPRVIEIAPIEKAGRRMMRNVSRYRQSQCPQVRIVRVDGSIYFGAIEHIQRALRDAVQASEDTRCLIINGRGVNFIDLSGLDFLCQERRHLEGLGVRLVISSLKGTVMDELKQRGYLDKFGAENLFETTEQAVSLCTSKLNASACADCKHRIFSECR